MEKEEFKKMLKLKSFTLARNIIKFVNKFPNNRAAWTITDQMLRAATSIGANIIEAQAASSRKDFANFLNHALKSGNETKFWLALSRDLDENLFSDAEIYLQQTDELVKILGSSIATLREKRI